MPICTPDGVGQDAAHALDHADRCLTIVVNNEQRSIDAVSTCDHGRLPQHLGCVPAAPYVREHAVTDMASLPCQELVFQGMPDGHAADKLAVNVGDQKRRPDASRWQVDGKPLPLEQLELLDPRHPLSILQPELEAIVRHHSMSCDERALVSCLQVPQPKRAARSRLVTVAPHASSLTGPHHSADEPLVAALEVHFVAQWLARQPARQVVTPKSMQIDE